MDQSDIEKNCEILHDILLRKQSEIIDQMKSIKTSAVSDNSWPRLSQCIMEHIERYLKEFDIFIPIFAAITSPNNRVQSLRYLLQLVQNKNPLKKSSLEKVKAINESLNRSRISQEFIFDCVEQATECVEDLANSIDSYNVNAHNRMAMYKSLKIFATEIYTILQKLGEALRILKLSANHDLSRNLTDLMKNLLKLSFVIWDYPPKLIKKATKKQTGTHFQASIASLIEKDNVFSVNLEPEIYFLEESELQNFIQTSTLNRNSKISCKDIKMSNNKWTFKNMLWNPSCRNVSDRRRSERITHMKSIILFKISIHANPSAFMKTFTIEKNLFSDTAISIVHSNQEVDALLVLFWDDYFRVNKRAFLNSGKFECKDLVQTDELIAAISDYFQKQTTRELTASNKDFLRQKLFSCFPNDVVTFQSFIKTTMPESQLSFGHWIFSIIKLLKVEGTSAMWTRNLIVGFSPKDSEAYLKNDADGTFILRFSERNPTIGVVLKYGSKNDAWSPFSIGECRSRSLPERLMDYGGLRYIKMADGEVCPKEESLKPFLTSFKPDDGYTYRGISSYIQNNIYDDNNSLTEMDNIDYIGAEMDNFDDIGAEMEYDDALFGEDFIQIE